MMDRRSDARWEQVQTSSVLTPGMSGSYHAKREQVTPGETVNTSMRTETWLELEDTTEKGDDPLFCCRDHGEQRDLEHPIEQPEQPLPAAVPSNQATTKSMQCQSSHTDSAQDPSATHPIGHVDGPPLPNQLVAVRVSQSQRQREGVEGAQAEALLHDKPSLADSLDIQAATSMPRLHSRSKLDLVQMGGQLSIQQDTLRVAGKDLRNFSTYLLTRFERYGDLADLQQVIAISKELAKSALVRDDRYGAGLADIGMALLYRFKHLGELSDLEDAISRFRNAIELAFHSHPDKCRYLNNLGTSLRIRFQRLGELSDLESAISILGNVLALVTDDGLGKLACFNNLGDCFFARFLRLGELGDLDNAVSCHKNAIGLIPRDHPRKSTCLTSLGVSLKARFERLRDRRDIDDSISSHKDAVDLVPDGHPDQPICLNNLGISFFARFQHIGELSDIEDAILMLKDAVDRTPSGHPDKAARLSNLGNAFKIRFEHIGELSDLEDAVSKHMDALDITPHGHPDKAGRLDKLGNALATRFQRLGEPSDLEDAILRHRNAVSLTPDSHPDKFARLNDLGTSLFTRFQRLGELSDIEEAISMFRCSVHLSPDDHLAKSVCLNNLGASLQARFDHFGDPGSLEDAISTLRDAGALTPDDHPDRPIHLKNLGCSLLAHFEQHGEPTSLDEAISTLRSAVDLTPDGHADKPDCLDNLGDALLVRFDHLGTQSDCEQAISQYSKAATADVGPIRVRFLASQKWTTCARRIRHRSLLHACAVTVDLLPQLAWLGHVLARRFAELKQGADVVREAAAVALDEGRTETAVEWLEQGRAIVWGELLQLRSADDALASAHPVHARRLRALSLALERASATRERALSALSEGVEDLRTEADRHRGLAIRREALIREIRRLPGFERFLKPKAFSELRVLAHSGPVVILNAAENRCDALIVLADVGHAVHVPLPNFTCKRAVELQNAIKGIVRDARKGRSVPWDDVSWESLLSSLWKCVVKPVLDALSFSTPGELSRIFWCPTGPFVFLPIHAAGLYDADHAQPGHKVFDFVVSSYAPTLAILEPPPDPAPHDALRLLVVRQPPTDGLPPLPGVLTELEHIQAAIQHAPSRILVQPASSTVQDVLAHMQTAHWVHVACHGVQDGLASGLCLADGRLTLRDLVGGGGGGGAGRHSRARGGLAFLSACETAAGDRDATDEAMHVAGGMVYAGFGGAIGAMWAVCDRVAPEVARGVYDRLFCAGGAPEWREAAGALWAAVGRVREDGAGFGEWVPFVHVGL